MRTTRFLVSFRRNSPTFFFDQAICGLSPVGPDPRYRWHQYYSSASGCRAASRTASQARWLAKPENQSYFCGPVNVARAQAWGAPSWLLAQGARCRPLRYKMVRNSGAGAEAKGE
jgi:hypothetical protein